MTSGILEVSTQFAFGLSEGSYSKIREPHQKQRSRDAGKVGGGARGEPAHLQELYGSGEPELRPERVRGRMHCDEGFVWNCEGDLAHRFGSSSVASYLTAPPATSASRSGGGGSASIRSGWRFAKRRAWLANSLAASTRPRE